MSDEKHNGMIRVVDDEGHLLFIYNPTNRSIELVPVRGRRLDGKRKVKCIIDTDKLRSAGMRNLLTTTPTHEVVAVVEEVQDA
jgi:hypothetical protein